MISGNSGPIGFSEIIISGCYYFEGSSVDSALKAEASWSSSMKSLRPLFFFFLFFFFFLSFVDSSSTVG